MKKLFFSVFLVVILVAGFGKSMKAQSLYFCEDVDESGSPKNPSSTFNIPSAGGYFYFLVKLPYAINCSYVNYKIYKVDYSGSETYNTTINQDGMSNNWTWFYKKVTFYETGTYKIYLKDCNGETLTSETVQINLQ